MPRISKTRKAVVAKMMKENIYEAATKVLRKYGVNGTTMNRVAEAANLTKSNLYYYLKDKDELLGFFNTRIVEPALQSIEGVVKSNQPALDKIEKILRTCRAYAGEHKELLMLVAGAEQSERLRQNVRTHILRSVRMVFEQGMQEGSFRPHDCEFTSHMFLGGVIELFELQVDAKSDAAVDRYVEAFVDVIHRGFSIVNVDKASISQNEQEAEQ